MLGGQAAPSESRRSERRNELGPNVGLGDILADEFAVLSVPNEEREKREAASGNPQTQPGSDSVFRQL